MEPRSPILYEDSLPAEPPKKSVNIRVEINETDQKKKKKKENKIKKPMKLTFFFEKIKKKKIW